MYSFLSYFRRYLDSKGVSHTPCLEPDCDVLFVNSFMVPYTLVRAAKSKLPSLRVVQRVDGAARDYGRGDDADARQARVNLLADLTIFQSHYGRYATTRKFKVISQDGPVICNPVDTAAFRPEGERLELPGRAKVAHVTFSTNPRKGAGSLFRVAASNPDIDFVLIGRYKAGPSLPNIHYLGVLDRQMLARALRACQAFVTFSENEACPNVVLEALATGLPVLYLDSGGTREIVGDCGLPVTPETFRMALDAVLARRPELSRAARARAAREFSPEVCFSRYLAAMKQAQRQPLPGAVAHLRTWRRGYPVLPGPRALLAWGRARLPHGVGCLPQLCRR